MKPSHATPMGFTAMLWAYFITNPNNRDRVRGYPVTVEWKGMGEVVNLRRARKKSERQRSELKAAANRLLHGRSKAERMLDAQRNAKSHRDLDRHRIETGDDR
jgi:Domain of unknown function (DUF4169)